MTVREVIKNMSDEDFAQFLLDIAYENSPVHYHEPLRIPSPFGGYLVDGVLDFRDTDVVVDALQEEVEE